MSRLRLCYEYERKHVRRLQLQELYWYFLTTRDPRDHVTYNQLIITSPFLSYLAVLMRCANTSENWNKKSTTQLWMSLKYKSFT